MSVIDKMLLLLRGPVSLTEELRLAYGEADGMALALCAANSAREKLEAEVNRLNGLLERDAMKHDPDAVPLNSHAKLRVAIAALRQIASSGIAQSSITKAGIARRALRQIQLKECEEDTHE